VYGVVVEDADASYTPHVLRCTELSQPIDVKGSIAPNAARVLHQRMSVGARKRQLATKVRRVVKGQQGTFETAVQGRGGKGTRTVESTVRSGDHNHRHRGQSAHSLSRADRTADGQRLEACNTPDRYAH